MNAWRMQGLLVFVSICAAWPLAAPAQAGPRQATVEQLQAELDRRDTIIADLLQRVQALERRLGAPAPSPRAATPAPAAPASAAEAADEALLERALERSLVLSGGALLPRGVRELEPALSYDYVQRSGLAALGTNVVTRTYRRENFGVALGLKAGLPWSSQVDVSLPYVHQRVEALVNGVAQDTSASGVGDVQVALTRQFLTERPDRFSLLAGVTWLHSRDDASLRPVALGLPDFASPAAIGVGHDAFAARLTAVKRMDPLVFVGAYSHTWNRAESIGGVSVKSGGADGISARAILATSPDVSVRAGFGVTRTGKTRLDGVTIEGTRSVASVLELGTSVVLGRNFLLDLALGVGLTSDSPDFVFGLSFPLRF